MLRNSLEAPSRVVCDVSHMIIFGKGNWYAYTEGNPVIFTSEKGSIL